MVARKKKAAAPRLPCGDLVGFQVRLDRRGILERADRWNSLGEFLATLVRPTRPRTSCAAGKPGLRDLGRRSASGSSEPADRDYTLTEADVKGPFEKVPPQRSPIRRS